MFRRNRDRDMAVRGSGALARPGDSRSPSPWFDEVDRWFDEVRREFERSFGWPIPGRPGTLTEFRQPLLDVRDTGSEFVVTAELPGVLKEDVEIETTPEGLEIKAEVKGDREEKDEDYYYRERGYQSWYRTVALPAEIVPGKVAANMRDGILEIRLPKQEPTPEAKPVKVKVQ